jgi:hypoxanthine phosphoribosyltransferase
MLNDVEKVIIDPGTISNRVAALAGEISRDFSGKDVILIGVLKGSMFFIADLLRKISIPVILDFIGTSSYGTATTTSGAVKITKDLEENIEGLHVIIVEDIVDTGLTLNFLINALNIRKPASISICTLLDKNANRQVNIPIRYRGFPVEDSFVVGYGLDFRDQYRHLPFVCTLKNEIHERQREK